jgi:hypothetical protein
VWRAAVARGRQEEHAALAGREDWCARDDEAAIVEVAAGSFSTSMVPTSPL